MRPICLTIAGFAMMCSCEDNFNRDQMLGITAASPVTVNVTVPANLLSDAEAGDDAMCNDEER